MNTILNIDNDLYRIGKFEFATIDVVNLAKKEFPTKSVKQGIKHLKFKNLAKTKVYALNNHKFIFHDLNKEDKDVIITNDLTDIECLFNQTDLYYGQDGNLYSRNQEDYSKPLAYIKKIDIDSNNNITYECTINI